MTKFQKILVARFLLAGIFLIAIGTFLNFDSSGEEEYKWLMFTAGGCLHIFISLWLFWKFKSHKNFIFRALTKSEQQKFSRSLIFGTFLVLGGFIIMLNPIKGLVFLWVIPVIVGAALIIYSIYFRYISEIRPVDK
jgi:O-antigen/teichoic acid export membrane protein